MEEVTMKKMNIFARIPKGTVKVEIIATLIDENDKFYNCFQTLNAEKIQQAREDFLTYVENGDEYRGYHTITEKGKDMLEELKKF